MNVLESEQKLKILPFNQAMDKMYLFPKYTLSSCLSLSFLRIPEFWVAQPWKHELWGVRGPKPFRMPSPPFIVTVSHDLWTLTGQASCFQPLMIYSSVDDSQFSFYDTFLSVFGVKDWIKPLIHIYVFRFESVKKRHTMRGDYGPHLSSFQICRLIT